MLTLSKDESYGAELTTGQILGRDPPVTPTIGMAVRWQWGYAGASDGLIAGFSGEICAAEQVSYPATWQVDVKDALFRATRSKQVIQSDPLNDVTAKDAATHILTTYGGIAASKIQLPDLSASGSEWSGSLWKLGQLTPVQWGNSDDDSGGTSALKAVQDIYAVFGYKVYADASGIIRARLMERRPSSAAFRTFQRGVDLLMRDPPKRSSNADDIRNRVIVRGADTGVDGAQIMDAWQTAHPLLPSGVYQETEFSSFLIEYINEAQAGAASATAVAKRILKLWSRQPDVVRAGIKADPRLSVGTTIGVKDSGVRLSTTKNYFIYGIRTDQDLRAGKFNQSLILDGGTGSQGYTTIPNPEASFSWRLVAETLDGGDAIVEVFLDGSGSASLSGGEIVSYAWSTGSTVYSGTPSSATGARAVLTFLASASPVSITLTVTDTTSKTGTITLEIDLTGADAQTPLSRPLSVAFGAAWQITTDGGATWASETTNGDAIAVAPIGAGGGERGPVRCDDARARAGQPRGGLDGPRGQLGVLGQQPPLVGPLAEDLHRSGQLVARGVGPSHQQGRRKTQQFVAR